MVAVLRAVGVTTAGVRRARALLAHHGLDPDADMDELRALVEDRGWWVTLEKVLGRGRGQPPRWTGHATLVSPPGNSAFRHLQHVRVRGVDGQEALVQILAKVLEKEQEP